MSELFAPIKGACACYRCMNDRHLYCPNITHTQKVAGLLALNEYAGTRDLSVLRLTVRGIVTKQGLLGQIYLPAFVRPCPHRPRHGYIESRVIKDEQVLATLVKEVLLDDPNGEVMITPTFEDITHNAIWTPSLLTVGLGHDGATAGKNTITIPLSGATPANKDWNDLLDRARVFADEDPYIEAILHANSTRTPKHPYTYLTQLRAGPKGAVIGNYVPKTLTVSEILQPNGEDLLAWETRIQSSGKTPGLVVYHPGGSPADHYSVHCRCVGLPVIYDHQPEVGDVLEPTDTPKLDPLEVLYGMVIASQLMTNKPVDRKGWAMLMIFGFHASAALSGKSSRLLGASIIAMLRLGVSALAGEARHCQSSGVVKLPTHRTEVWDMLDGKSLTQVRGMINKLINTHMFGKFQSSGFGGLKWAQCGASLLPIFNGVSLFARAKTAQDEREALNVLLQAMNIAINQAHNGGWWMNKFVDQRAFGTLQLNDPYWVLAPELLESIYAVMTAQPKYVRRTASIWAKWPKAQFDVPPISIATAHVDLVKDVLLCEVVFDYLNGGSRAVHIPLTDQIAKALVQGGKLFIEVKNSSLYLYAGVDTEPLKVEPVLEPQQIVAGANVTKTEDDEEDDQQDNTIDDDDDDV